MKVSSFVTFVPIFWWMELDLVFLNDSVMSRSVFWGMYGFVMALDSLPANMHDCVLLR